jgi:hypothetical protein
VEDELSKGAVIGRRGQELDARTEVVLQPESTTSYVRTVGRKAHVSCAALLTVAAGDAGLQSNAIARLQVGDLGADLCNNARAFVTCIEEHQKSSESEGDGSKDGSKHSVYRAR